MTALASFFGSDSRGPASIYITSDSRMSWLPGSKQWNRGRKIFASQKYAEVFGYCGDVLFPTQLLGQALDLLDRDLFYCTATDPLTKQDILKQFLIKNLDNYTDKKNLNFKILYASRENAKSNSIFHAHILEYRAGHFLDNSALNIQGASDVLCVLGSGERSVNTSLKRWQNSEVHGTSRCIYSAFCEAVESGQDPMTGGPTQLVGIYREGAAKLFGTIWRGKPYVLGTEPMEPNLNIEWRNSLFERCDPNTLKPLEKAQRHHKPRSLEK